MFRLFDKKKINFKLFEESVSFFSLYAQHNRRFWDTWYMGVYFRKYKFIAHLEKSEEFLAEC